MELKEAYTIGNLERVKEIISGEDIHADAERALRYASWNGEIEVVKYLIEQGADIHALDDRALRSASNYGHLEIVQYLIEKGANIRTDALLYACWYGHLEVVKCLVENGANIINIDLDDEFIFYGNSEIVEYMKLIKFLKILSKHWRERQKFIKK